MIVGEEYTSRTCSCCSTVKDDLKVSDRVYNCINCKIEIDRDLNGAINIRKVGLNEFKPIGIDIAKIRDKYKLIKNGSVQATSKEVCSI